MPGNCTVVAPNTSSKRRLGNLTMLVQAFHGMRVPLRSTSPSASTSRGQARIDAHSAIGATSRVIGAVRLNRSQKPHPGRISWRCMWR